MYCMVLDHGTHACSHHKYVINFYNKKHSKSFLFLFKFRFIYNFSLDQKKTQHELDIKRFSN